MSDDSNKINEEACKPMEPQQEHKLLERLLGDWTFEADCKMGQDQPPDKSTGWESVRSMRGMWFIGEGETQMGDMTGATMITLGYNPATKRYVGSWVGSMMTHMWVYDGEMDAEGKVLTLNAEGPDFTKPGKTAKYQDIIEFVSDGHRTLRSRAQGENGEWVEFMKADYRRK